MDEKPPRFRLNGTRIFLIVMVAVALTLATMTIVASLGTWREQDAAVSAPSP